MTQKRKKYHVFLSHNSIDKLWVNRLKDALESRGLKVWLDQDEIRPGDLFVDALERGLENSRAVALIVSPEAMQSDWVKEEYNRAMSLAQDKQEPLRLIPVILRQAKLPGFLSGRNWVDFTDESSFDKSLDQLIWGITNRKHSASKLQNSQSQENEVRPSALSASIRAPTRKQEEKTSLPTHRQNHGDGRLLDEEQYLTQVHACFQKADDRVRAAFALFDEQKTNVPGQFKKAIEYLETASEQMQQFSHLLGKPSSTQQAVGFAGCSSILHQINIATDQINNHLVPSLRQNIPGRFISLIKAMDEIKKLLL